MKLYSIAEINVLAQEQFTDLLGSLYEHSPWIARETWTRRPFENFDQLFLELCLTLRDSSPDQRLELIKAHPDLAGRLLEEEKLTDASRAEQASAGLDRLGPEDAEQFRTHNQAYRDKFGFPFVICARLNDKSAILEALRERLEFSPEAEMRKALEEIDKIARLRLQALSQPSL